MQMRTSCPYENKYYIRQVNNGWNGAIQGYPTKNGANVLANCVRICKSEDLQRLWGKILYLTN